MIQLMQGNCLFELENVPDNSVDMILTDPPYSSGGMFAGNRKKDTKSKYTSDEYSGAARFQNFSGDNMDQRVFMAFYREVFGKAKKKMKEGGDNRNIY